MRTGRWAVLAAAVCLVVAAVAVACAAGQVKAVKVLTADTVRAKRVEVVDAEGRTRGGLHMSDDGQPVLTLWDDRGEKRAMLALKGKGEPGLTLWDGRGGIRAMLVLGGDGTPGLVLVDGSNEVRAALGLAADGTPSLLLGDRNGNDRAVLGRADLRPAGTKGTEQTAESSLVLLDGEGKVLWRAP